MTARAPRNLAELTNVIALLREATGILDCDGSLRSDERTFELADRAYDLLCDARDLLELYHTETGHGYAVPGTIEIRNKIVIEDETLAEIDRALQENVG